MQSTECDSTNLQLSQEKWWHNKASVAVEVYKHCYIGVSLLNMQMAYSDITGINQKKIYNVPTLMLYYKANGKHKLSLDAGAELCRTNYDRDLNSIPIEGKYGINLGHNIGLNYRVWRHVHVTAQLCIVECYAWKTVEGWTNYTDNDWCKIL